MGAAVSTVYYNLKLRHPTIDMPIIDYDLAVLIQPMLMLGISIGVAFNVVFADWMVTVLLIVLFLLTSTKAFLRGVETWKKETIIKKVSPLYCWKFPFFSIHYFVFFSNMKKKTFPSLFLSFSLHSNTWMQVSEDDLSGRISSKTMLIKSCMWIVGFC